VLSAGPFEPGLQPYDVRKLVLQPRLVVPDLYDEPVLVRSIELVSLQVQFPQASVCLDQYEI
jgi:hypothetical protein